MVTWDEKTRQVRRLAQSLPQSKPPEAGGGGCSASQSLCFPRGQVGLGGRSPRPLPLNLGDLGSRRSTSPACPDPKPLGRQALLSSDEHIHPPKLSSSVRLPRKLSHQVVCRLPHSHPAAGNVFVTMSVCPATLGPRHLYLLHVRLAGTVCAQYGLVEPGSKLGAQMPSPPERLPGA